jgi:hypothetical protein
VTRALSAAALLLGLPLIGLLGQACTESAQSHVRLELRARGRPVESTLADDTVLTLSRAQLAFGPFYLCAGAQAGQSCDTALAQWGEAQVLDVLSEATVDVGTLEGYSGRALSYMHDCGIVSLLTNEAPLVLPAAQDLDGGSVWLEGVAELPLDGAPAIPFRIFLTISSSADADRGQPVVRSSPGQFDAEIGPLSTGITLSFDASAWLGGLDRSAFWQDAPCSDDGPTLVCAGGVSQDCQSETTEDCAESARICAPGKGCQDAVVLDGATAAGRAVAQAITLAAGLTIEVD